MVAIITDDLQQALLLSSTVESSTAAKEALARKLEDGIVLSRRPIAVTALDPLEEFAISSGRCARVKPRKNDIHREIRGA